MVAVGAAIYFIPGILRPYRRKGEFSPDCSANAVCVEPVAHHIDDDRTGRRVFCARGLSYEHRDEQGNGQTSRT